MMKKVLIIGAGPAGLTAAYELLDRSAEYEVCLLYTSDAADDMQCVDLGGRGII